MVSTTNIHRDSTSKSLYAPRNWPVWLGFWLLRLCVLLPFPALLALGRAMGRLGMRLDKRRATIARINLERCFPELGEADRERLLLRHFESLGMGVMEAGLSWWGNEQRYFSRVRTEGEEHIASAFAKGKGVIIFTAHFTSMEIAGHFIHRYTEVRPVYRPHENPVARHFIDKGRNSIGKKSRHDDVRALIRTQQERFTAAITPIRRDDVRTMIRALRDKEAIWLATDQNFAGKGSVFANFFHVPAATNAAVPRLAKVTGAVVLPAVVLRREDHSGYEMIFEPALESFPSGDDAQDTETLNRIIEKWARRAPEQYFWVHRRFKSRPDHEKRFYPPR
jgi:KDO2-lipid IV(A) lauroyltransferase